MSRGLIIGAFWYDAVPAGDGEKYERAIAGTDEVTRETLDRFVNALPDRFRPQVCKFLAPLLENNEPSTPSQHLEGADFGFVWWKRAFVLGKP